MITVVGCHAGGEVGNVVVGGVLPPPGATVFEQMQVLQADDSLRKLLLHEPRGSVAFHANLVVPSRRPDCAAGFIIMEPTEYPPMSGSNTICVTTVLLETGMVEMREPETTLRLEAPAGAVDVTARCANGKCESVELTNVPCFADRLDAALEVEGLGTLTVDVAFGGMWYAIADAAELGFALEPSEAADLSRAGERIRIAAREQLPCTHPENPEIAGVSIVQIAQPWQGQNAVSKNAVVVAPGRLDRSATGTGLLRTHGGAARAGAARPRRRDEPRLGDRLDLRGPDRLGDHRRRAPGDRSRDSRQRLGHGLHATRARSERSVSGGVRPLGHLAGRGRPVVPFQGSPVARNGLTLVAVLALAAALLPGGSDAAYPGIPSIYVSYNDDCTFSMTADGGFTFTASSPPGPTLPPGVYRRSLVLMPNPPQGYACGTPAFTLSGPGVNSVTTFPQQATLDNHVLPALQPSSTYTAFDQNAPTATRVYFTTSGDRLEQLARHGGADSDDGQGSLAVGHRRLRHHPGSRQARRRDRHFRARNPQPRTAGRSGR